MVAMQKAQIGFFRRRCKCATRWSRRISDIHGDAGLASFRALRESSDTASSARCEHQEKDSTAFSTGLAPSRMRPYISTVRGASRADQHQGVVLKFSETTSGTRSPPAPISGPASGYGSVIVRSTRGGAEAPRFPGGLFERRVEALQGGAPADGERGDRDDVRETGRAPRAAGRGRSRSSFPGRTHRRRTAAMRLAKREDRDAQESRPGMTRRREHQQRQRRLAAETGCASIRKALTVPTATDSTVTQPATSVLVHRLRSQAARRRTRRCALPRPMNQSSRENRAHGGAGVGCVVETRTPRPTGERQEQETRRNAAA